MPGLRLALASQFIVVSSDQCQNALPHGLRIDHKTSSGNQLRQWIHTRFQSITNDVSYLSSVCDRDPYVDRNELSIRIDLKIGCGRDAILRDLSIHAKDVVQLRKRKAMQQPALTCCFQSFEMWQHRVGGVASAKFG